MRRALVLAVTSAFVMAISVVPGAAATPQPEDPLGLLSFSVDPKEADYGDEVGGTVDVSNVNELCNAEITDDPEDGEGPWDWREVWVDNYAAYTGAVEDAYEPDNPDMLDGTTYLGAAWLGLATLLPGGIATGLDENQAFLGSFALVMADIATQDQLVVVQQGWNPETGEAGGLVIPEEVEVGGETREITPGLYAIVVACANINTVVTDEGIDAIWDGVLALEAIMADSSCAEGGFLLACLLGIVPAADPPPILPMISEVAPDVLSALFVPWAIGFDLLCVVDETGVCPQEIPPTNGDEAPAEAVTTAPRFTG